MTDPDVPGADAVRSGSPRDGRVDPSFWAGRRVLITGHTGFKGSWLTLWLQALGAQVTGLSDGVLTDPSLFETARVADGIEDLRGDIVDFDVVRRAVRGARPEVVIHMAAQSLVRPSFTAPRRTYELNVMGTVNVLDAVRQAEGVRAVVNVTSDKCYDNREWEWGYRESEPMGGHDPYSSSKGCSELVPAAFRRSFFARPDAPKLASVRAGNVIGGGDWAVDRLVPDIMRAALAGETVLVRNPNSVRPWQHVLNPVSGYLLLAQALYDDERFATGWNFGPPEEDARPVQWIVDRVGSSWPEPVRSASDPGPHPHEATYLKLDSARARSRLGWRPQIDLERALDATAAWYRAFADGSDMRMVTLDQIRDLSDLP